MFYLIFWIVVVTAFTFLGAWYVRKYNRPDALIALYVTFVILSQIIAAKIAEYDLGFMVVTAPAAVIIYSVTYLFTDIVNEKFGRTETHRMIAIAFASQVAMVFFLWLGTIVKPAPFWQGQAAWDSIIGLVPRITLASMIAFLVSENLDAVVFHFFKKLTHGKYLWMRTVVSGIPSLTVDTLLFITIAFYGSMPLQALFIGQIATKYLVGLINIPFMYFNRWIMYGGQPYPAPGITHHPSLQK
jgi:queuosine precursor transporter